MRAWSISATIFLALTDQTSPWKLLRPMLVKLIDSKLIIFLLFAAHFALQGVCDAPVIRRIVNHSLGSEAAYDLRVCPRVRSVVFDAEVQSARYWTQRKDVILPCQIWARARRSSQSLGCLSVKCLKERVSICWEKLWEAVGREEFSEIGHFLFWFYSVNSIVLYWRPCWPVRKEDECSHIIWGRLLQHYTCPSIVRGLKSQRDNYLFIFFGFWKQN